MSSVLRQLAEGEQEDGVFSITNFTTVAIRRSTLGRKMRSLWPIERDVLEAAAVAHPACIVELRQQAEMAKVVDFHNSGAGFVSALIVDCCAPAIAESSPLDGPSGDVSGIDVEMGFIVFLKDGRLDAIEGFCYGESSTNAVDFSSVAYRLTAFGPKQNVAIDPQ